MKIKSLGFTSLKLSFKNIDVITDPVEAKEYTNSFEKNSADAVVFSAAKYSRKENILKSEGFESKVEAKERGNVFEISNPGEMELGEVFIRRPLNGNFYIFDEGDVRVVFIGFDSKDLDSAAFKNLGDVDVLIVPAGNSGMFMDYEKLEKVIEMIDPTVLIPIAFKTETTKVEGLSSFDDFIKYFGYTHVSEESTYTVTKGKEEEDKIMTVVKLS